MWCGVLFLSVQKEKDFVTLHISSIDDILMSASSNEMSNDKYLDIYYDNLIIKVLFCTVVMN